MGLVKQLFVTLVDNGSGVVHARYVRMRGNAVLDEGECAPNNVPNAAEARAAFFSRSGYFDRVEVEVRNVRTLSFQARRMVEGAVVFNEPFKTRYATKQISGGRFRLDLAAVADGDIHASLAMLPVKNTPFTRLVMAESAIAALIATETNEPAAVLWMRGSVIIGMLVEKGVVLARTMDRTAAGSELDARVGRVRATLASAAHRLFTDREVTLSLALGELAGKTGTGDMPSRTFESQLTRRFSGARDNTVLEWPELYGLSVVPACYSFLNEDYQEAAVVSRYAAWVGGALLACGVVAAVAATGQYLAWKNTNALFTASNSKLDADYTALKTKLPSPELLAALAQRNNNSSAQSDFRADAFMAWVSKLTPLGATIRHLEIKVAAPVPAVPGAVAPATDAAALTPTITIEWDVAGDYPEAEKLTGGLLAGLSARSTLSNSHLEYKAGDQSSFTTVLQPVAGAFKE